MLIDRNNKPSESILYIAAQLHDFMSNNKFANIDVQKKHVKITDIFYSIEIPHAPLRYVSIADVFDYTEKTNMPFLKVLYALDWLFLIGFIVAVDSEGRLMFI